MSRANPEKAVRAILPTPVTTPEGLEVRPMTLAMYAALERIGSPLVTGAEAKNTLELVPSVYLLTHGAEEIFKANLLELAMAWADTVPVTAIGSVRRACEEQMQTVMDVMPQAAQKKTGAGTTAGSPPPSTSRRGSTAGATAKSCGRCRSRR